MLFETFAGRDEELDALKALREESARGRAGMLVTIAGEAGIGKTRLLREFRTSVEKTRGALAWASAHDGAKIPFALCTELFAQMRLPKRASLDEASAAARTLLDANGAGSDEAAPAARVAALVASLLEIARRAVHLTLVIDDVQWCDAASLDVIGALARAIAEAPLLLVLAFRDREWLDDPARAAKVARLMRDAGARIDLAPLPDAVITALVSVSLPPERASAVCKLAEGSPFAAEELGRTFAHGDGERRFPTTLTGAIEERLRRLPGGARDILVAAAVLGREFSFADLVRSCGREARDVVAALRGARDGQIVVEVDEASGERFRFRHALTRETLYATLLKLEAAELHRTIADHLELHEPQRLNEIAFHRWSARDGERAPPACVRAAEAAIAVGAPNDACELYLRALEFEPADAAFFVETVRAAVFTLNVCNRAREAYDLSVRARARIDPERYPREATYLIGREAAAANRAGMIDRACELAEEYLAAAGDDPAARNAAISVLANALSLKEDWKRCLDLIAQYRPECGSVADTFAMNLLEAQGLFATGQVTRSLARFEHLIASEAYDAIGHRLDLVENLMFANAHLGRLERAIELADSILGVASAVPVSFLRVRAYAALLDVTLGNVDRVRRYLSTLPATAPDPRRRIVALRVALATFDRTDLPAAADDEYEAALVEPRTLGPLAAALAWAHEAQPVRARSIVDRAMEAMRGIHFAFDFFDAAIAFGSDAVATRALEKFSALEAIPEHEAAHAYLALGRARIASRGRRTIAARECAEDAVARFRRLGWPIATARALTVAGRGDEAAAIFASFARRTTPAVDAPAALSRREEQIARAAAAGLSSREIGEKFAIAPRTVEAHLRKAYEKLNVNSRVELAGALRDK